MNIKIISSFIILGVVMMGATIWVSKLGPTVSSDGDGTFISYPVTLHKSLTCGCCAVYGSYMRRIGYEVIENNIYEINRVKKELGIPAEVWSCHTSEIGGYVVEGHIPNHVIEKLLKERPDIKGIGMAGMPSGSPGMPGPKEEFLIYEINNDGTLGKLFMEM